MSDVTLAGSDATGRPGAPEPAAARAVTAWSDLPTGDSRFDQVRRELRVRQIHRAASGRGLAA